MKPIIWVYWENKPGQSDPLIVQRCKEIFRQYKNVIILNENTIKNYVNLIDCSHIKILAYKGDYYRAKLLSEYGGIWFDADSILLDDFSDLYDQLLNSDFEMCAENSAESCSPSCLLFKPKSVIAKKWSLYCEEMILAGKCMDLNDWGQLAGYALARIIKETNNSVMEFPGRYMFSLGYENRIFMNYYSQDARYIKQQLQQIKTQGAKVITLYGTFMYNLIIPNQCLLEQMWTMAKINE
jgi:lipopolysaccharide biosynthesis glycosyltransferase